MEKEKEKIKEKVLRWQLLGERFVKDNSNVFIKKINGDLHFCKIVLVGETKVCVDNYAPVQRAGKRDYIDWLQIETFEEVEE